MILGLGQEKYKMSLEHLVCASKWERLKGCWGYVKRTQKQTERTPTGQTWDTSKSKYMIEKGCHSLNRKTMALCWYTTYKVNIWPGKGYWHSFKVPPHKIKLQREQRVPFIGKRLANTTIGSDHNNPHQWWDTLESHSRDGLPREEQHHSCDIPAREAQQG